VPNRLKKINIITVNKKRKKPESTQTSSAPSNLSKEIPQKEKDQLIQNRLHDALNAVELKKSMDKWLKTTEGQNSVMMRDLTILKGVNEEYLNSFFLLGYTMEDERVIIQSYRNPKDKDAMMEFLKNVFIQQCQQNNQEE
jgi:hypothetical protein